MTASAASILFPLGQIKLKGHTCSLLKCQRSELHQGTSDIWRFQQQQTQIGIFLRIRLCPRSAFSCVNWDVSQSILTRWRASASVSDLWRRHHGCCGNKPERMLLSWLLLRFRRISLISAHQRQSCLCAAELLAAFKVGSRQRRPSGGSTAAQRRPSGSLKMLPLCARSHVSLLMLQATPAP